MRQEILDKKTLKIIKKKNLIRIEMKAKRAQLSEQEIEFKSQIIEEKILDLAIVKKTQNIMCYVSKDTEVVTHHLIKALLKQGKTVVVPFIVKKGLMKPAIIKSFSELILAEFDTLQPREPKILTTAIDLNLMPALAVSKSGERIGWGAGFYDNFIVNYQPKFNLCLAFACQLVDSLPITKFDKKVDGVMTENQYIKN